MSTSCSPFTSVPLKALQYTVSALVGLFRLPSYSLQVPVAAGPFSSTAIPCWETPFIGHSIQYVFPSVCVLSLSCHCFCLCLGMTEEGILRKPGNEARMKVSLKSLLSFSACWYQHVCRCVQAIPCECDFRHPHWVKVGVQEGPRLWVNHSSGVK